MILRPPKNYNEYLVSVPMSIDWMLKTLQKVVKGENVVTQINAGSNITISPLSGLGQVTINASVPATPTLAQVTTAGNTTTNAITVNKLTVTGTGETYNMIVGSASDTTNWNQFISSEGTGEYGIYQDALYFQALSSLANGIRFFNGTTGVMQFSQNGNFSIGTTTDSGYKLDVNGTGIFRGNLEVNAGANGGIFVNNVYPRLIFGKTGTPKWSMYADTENAGQFEIGYGAGYPYNTFSSYIYLGTSGQGGIGLFGIPNGNTKLLITGSTSAQSNLAQGVYFNNTLVAAANNDVLVGLDITSNFTNGAFTGVKNVALRTNGLVVLGTSAYTYGSTYTSGAKLTIENTGGYNGLAINNGAGSYQFSIKTTTSDGIGVQFYWADGNTNPFFQHANSVGTIVGQISIPVILKGSYTALGYAIGYGYNEGMRVAVTTGNILINTTTDAGYKLDVNGTTRVQGAFYQTTANTTGTLMMSLLNGSFTVEKYQENGNNLGSILIKAKNNSSLVDSIVIDYSGLRAFNIIKSDVEMVIGTGSGGALRWSSNSAAYGWRINVGTNFGIQSAYANSSPTWSEYFTIIHQTQTGAGNVGIGTTTPTAKLQVSASITASSLLAQGVYFNNTLVAAANNDILVGLDINPTFTNGAFTGVQNIALRTQTGDVYLATTSGSVGIGTTSPTDKLEILGTQTTSFSVHSTGTGSNGRTAFTLARIPSVGSTNETGWQFLKDANDHFVFRSISSGNATDRAYLFTSGNFAIGTTTDAGYKLDVNGTFRTTSTITATLANVSTANVVYYNSSTGLMTYGAAPSGGTPTLATVTTSGNTTTNSISVGGLTVANSAAPIATFNSSNGGGTYIGIQYSGSLKAAWGMGGNIIGGLSISDVGFWSSNAMAWEAGGAQRMFLTSGGNFLINTISDNGNRLQVNGTIDGQAFAVNGVNGFTGTFTVSTNPVGQRNLNISNGIITSIT